VRTHRSSWTQALRKPVGRAAEEAKPVFEATERTLGFIRGKLVRV